jgi:hypothetical protein
VVRHWYKSICFDKLPFRQVSFSGPERTPSREEHKRFQCPHCLCGPPEGPHRFQPVSPAKAAFRGRPPKKPLLQYSQQLREAAGGGHVEEQFNYIYEYLRSTCFTMAPVRHKICVHIVREEIHKIFKPKNAPMLLANKITFVFFRLRCMNILFQSSQNIQLCVLQYVAFQHTHTYTHTHTQNPSLLS